MKSVCPEECLPLARLPEEALVMPKHRGLTLNKFVTAIPWDLFERYFATLELEEDVSGWVLLGLLLKRNLEECANR